MTFIVFYIGLFLGSTVCLNVMPLTCEIFWNLSLTMSKCVSEQPKKIYWVWVGRSWKGGGNTLILFFFKPNKEHEKVEYPLNSLKCHRIRTDPIRDNWFISHVLPLSSSHPCFSECTSQGPTENSGKMYKILKYNFNFKQL